MFSNTGRTDTRNKYAASLLIWVMQQFTRAIWCNLSALKNSPLHSYYSHWPGSISFLKGANGFPCCAEASSVRLPLHADHNQWTDKEEEAIATFSASPAEHGLSVSATMFFWGRGGKKTGGYEASGRALQLAHSVNENINYTPQKYGNPL